MHFYPWIIVVTLRQHLFQIIPLRSLMFTSCFHLKKMKMVKLIKSAIDRPAVLLVHDIFVQHKLVRKHQEVWNPYTKLLTYLYAYIKMLVCVCLGKSCCWLRLTTTHRVWWIYKMAEEMPNMSPFVLLRRLRFQVRLCRSHSCFALSYSTLRWDFNPTSCHWCVCIQ